jgi:hypothetical protein
MELECEKRRYLRIADPVCAWISFQKDSAAYGTLTLDLGLEGARFNALRKVERGTRLLVSIQLRSDTIECKGKVCWTETAENGLQCFGVRFLDLSEAERFSLQEFLHQSPSLAMAM